MEEGRLEVGEPEWGPVRRILFRFGFTYLFLYLLSTFLLLLAFIPYGESAVGWYFELWSVLVPWVARHLFQATALPHSTGSGDSLYRWMQVACFATLAALVALAWTLVDRKRKSYPRLYEGLRLYVRLGLGMTMIQYGAFKIVPSQFPQPSLDRLRAAGELADSAILSGGKGGVRNVIVGTALVGVLLNGMTILNVGYTAQNLIKSVILLAAIIIDTLINPRDEQTAQQGDI